jgi:hypothetical protein
MKAIVFPNAAGVISEAGKIIGQPVAASAVIVDIASLDIEPMTAARLRADGSVEIVPNHVGSGPWYDQDANTADRLTPIEITELGIEPAPGWAMTPRPETAQEITAREAAEATARAAAETLARANAVVTRRQFRLALFQLDLLDDVEAIMADPATPRATVIDWQDATEFHRSWPAWEAFLPLMNKTEADLDQVFALAKTL